MSIKPILFNTDMVRALLDNRKTVTRRVVKPQPRAIYYDGKVYDDDGLYVVAENKNGSAEQIELPYRPDDILYVRETFFEHKGHFFYKADGKHEALARLGITFKWHPSIHMPREAARIFLRVTDVRAERLQEITEEGARAEGVEPIMITADVDKPDTEREWHEWGPALPGFIQLWDSTIKKADHALYGWDANPWVWVIEFERCEKPKGD